MNSNRQVMWNTFRAFRISFWVFTIVMVPILLWDLIRSL